MKVIPYLNFDGRCAEALKFYEKILGGRTLMKMTWGESPMGAKIEPAWKDKIIHATFSLDGQEMGAADSPPEYYQKPQGLSITLNIASPEQAEKIFKALSENGKVSMPIQETFWARRFGMFTDQFGIPWMINCGMTA
ncbi:MAG TPA: VOC family protein [Elusimicrobiota bacterium]|nr:VOC family protein [Elusimicrobiota bacterium]